MEKVDDELMKAQVLTDIECLEYKEISIPKFKSDEVLVKIITAAVCNGSDPNLFKGYIQEKTPYVFGHEPFGVVVACGSELKNIKIGDRISWWFKLGAFAEYVAVNPSKVALAKIPKEIGEKEAPIMELVAASSRAVKAAGIKLGSRVLILGLGPSGLIMSQLAKIKGASKVVGWDLYEMRRNKGLELGCDSALDPTYDNVSILTKQIIGEVDIIIDAMGNDLLPEEPTIDRAIKLLTYGGRIVSYGHPSKGRRFSPYEFQSRNLSLVAPEQRIDEIQILIDECVQFIVSGELKIKPLVSAEVSLENMMEGLKMVMDHPEKYLKVIIRIEKS